MKKLLGALFSVSLLLPSLAAAPALANYDEYLETAGTSEDFGSCTVDPIYEHDWSGTVTTGARVRSIACMDGSTVLTTLAVGTKVRIVGETDGWWRVKLQDGRRGWVGMQLLTKSESPLAYSEKTEVNVTEKSTTVPTLTDAQKAALRARVIGRILLDVENHGEAWFVDVTGERTYMKDGEAAYGIMRAKGLGMTESDYERLAAGNTELKRRLLGRIILRVHKHGEAYYVHPDTGALTYLKDGPAAYTAMRELGLGIKSADLSSVPTEN